MVFCTTSALVLALACGLGALVSKRFMGQRWLMPVLLGVLVVITIFYEVGLDNLTDSLLDQTLAIRVIVSLIALAPLGFTELGSWSEEAREVAFGPEGLDEYTQIKTIKYPAR